MRRASGAALVLVLLMSFALPASAKSVRDRNCVPTDMHTGYYGATLSQSFHPQANTVAAVSVLLIATRPDVDAFRIRLVGQRSLPEGAAAQTTVLAGGLVPVHLAAYRPTWVTFKLPTPLAWASAGPAPDQYAVEVQLPAGDDSVFWVNCRGNADGSSYVDIDPGSVGQRDTGTAIDVPQTTTLAFVVYRSLK